MTTAFMGNQSSYSNNLHHYGKVRKRLKFLAHSAQKFQGHKPYEEKMSLDLPKRICLRYEFDAYLFRLERHQISGIVLG